MLGYDDHGHSWYAALEPTTKTAMALTNTIIVVTIQRLRDHRRRTRSIGNTTSDNGTSAQSQVDSVPRRRTLPALVGGPRGRATCHRQDRALSGKPGGALTNEDRDASAH